MDELERCYQILGLGSGASTNEIKQAYRDMAKVWHPDRFVHDPRLQQKAQEKLKEINRAYEVLLSSPTKSRKNTSSGENRTESSQTTSKRKAATQDEPPSEKLSTRRSIWKIILIMVVLLLSVSIYWLYRRYSRSGNYIREKPQLSQQNPISLSNDSMLALPSKHSSAPNKEMVESVVDSFIAKTARNLGANENKEVRKIGYGDLDDDGDQDVAVTYAIEGVNGGNNSHTQLAVFRNDEGKLSFVDKKAFADYERVVLLVSISNGRIICDTFSWAEQDPHCCPSLKKPSAFILSQNKLKEIRPR